MPRWSGPAQFFGQFQRYFPALGKHALVVLAHAHNVHSTGIFAHKRERADLPDTFVAALIVFFNIQVQAIDFRTEIIFFDDI